MTVIMDYDKITINKEYYEFILKAGRLYSIINDSVMFDGDRCEYTCEMTCPDCSDVDISLDYCCLFNESLVNGKRCQQCLEIFNDVL